MDITSLGRGDSWSGVRVLVVGFDTAGQSCADNLLHLGATVYALDPSGQPDRHEFAELLSTLGAEVLRYESTQARFRTPWLAARPFDVVVASGDRTARRVLRSVQTAYPEIPVSSALDIARQLEPDQPWILVGATEDVDIRALWTSVRTAELLRTIGIKAAPAGGVGRAPMELVMEPEPYDVLVVAVTPQELALSRALHPTSGSVLVKADGLGEVYTDVRQACVYNADSPATEHLVVEAEVTEGARAIGVTLGTPRVGMLGVVEDVLCERAFIPERQTTAAELCTVGDLKRSDPAYVQSVLASVALARAYGVALAPIRYAIGETF